MSSGQTGEKTEQPTAKKLRDARKEGQTLKSKDFSTAIAHLVYLLIMYFEFGGFYAQVADLVAAVTGPGALDLDAVLPRAVQLTVRANLYVILYFGLTNLVVPVGVAAVLRTATFAPKKLAPKMQNINPVEGVKRIFSMMTLVEFIKNVAKLFLIIVIFVGVTYWYASDIYRMGRCGEDCMALIGMILIKAAALVVLVFLLVGLLDIKLQHILLIRQLKMTKEEVKKDTKETQGDPTIKSERKSVVRREISEDEALEDTTFAVYSPGRYIVLLKYHKKDAPLPYVLLKGRNTVATRLMNDLRLRKKPLFAEPGLAARLYNRCQPGDGIPKSLFTEVAKLVMKLQ